MMIPCPYCGKKYTPSEIFIPSSFFGKSTIYNDRLIGTPMDLTESYECDICKNLFTVSAEISFKAKKTKIGRFDEDFIQVVR